MFRRFLSLSLSPLLPFAPVFVPVVFCNNCVNFSQTTGWMLAGVRAEEVGEPVGGAKNKHVLKWQRNLFGEALSKALWDDLITQPANNQRNMRCGRTIVPVDAARPDVPPPPNSLFICPPLLVSLSGSYERLVLFALCFSFCWPRVFYGRKGDKER